MKTCSTLRRRVKELRRARDERQPGLVEPSTYRFRATRWRTSEEYRTRSSAGVQGRLPIAPSARLGRGRLHSSTRTAPDRRPRHRARRTTRAVPRSADEVLPLPAPSRSTTTSNASATQVRAGTRSTSAVRASRRARTSVVGVLGEVWGWVLRGECLGCAGRIPWPSCAIASSHEALRRGESPR